MASDDNVKAATHAAVAGDVSTNYNGETSGDANENKNNNTNKQYELAFNFLQNPKIYGLPDDRKIDFLVKKGIDRTVIEAALQNAKTFSSSAETKLLPMNGTESKVGFIGLIWKLIKYASGFAFSVFVFKRVLLPYVARQFGWRLGNGNGVKSDKPGRIAAERRQADWLLGQNSSSQLRTKSDRRPLDSSSASNECQDVNSTDNNVLLKKLDSIAASLQQLIARQDAANESLNAFLKSQPANSGSNGGKGEQLPGSGNGERLLAELADLKAMLVSPNRFPPLPSSTYVPSMVASKNKREQPSTVTSTTSSNMNGSSQSNGSSEDNVGHDGSAIVNGGEHLSPPSPSTEITNE